MSNNETYNELLASFEWHEGHYANLMEAHNAGEEQDSDGNDLWESMDPLNIDKSTIYTVWITMGGPNIYVDVELDLEGYVKNMTYKAHWGGTTLTRSLSEDDDGLGSWAAMMALQMSENGF